MVQRITFIKQTPNSEDNWLYIDDKENNRSFSKLVCLPEGTPLWEECTDEDKLAWENAWKEEHKVKETEL